MRHSLSTKAVSYADSPQGAVKRCGGASAGAPRSESSYPLPLGGARPGPRGTRLGPPPRSVRFTLRPGFPAAPWLCGTALAKSRTNPGLPEGANMALFSLAPSFPKVSFGGDVLGKNSRYVVPPPKNVRMSFL